MYHGAGRSVAVETRQPRCGSTVLPLAALFWQGERHREVSMELGHLRALVPVRAGYRLERMLIISAYAGPEFFRAVDRELKPRMLGVVLDEGVGEDVVASIRSAVAEPRWKGGGLAHARRSVERLMHSKLYALSWRGDPVPAREPSITNPTP